MYKKFLCLDPEATAGAEPEAQEITETPAEESPEKTVINNLLDQGVDVDKLAAVIAEAQKNKTKSGNPAADIEAANSDYFGGLRELLK